MISTSGILLAFVLASIGYLWFKRYTETLRAAVEEKMPSREIENINMKLLGSPFQRRLQRVRLYHFWLTKNKRFMQTNRQLYEALNHLQIAIPKHIQSQSKYFILAYALLNLPFLLVILFMFIELMGVFDFKFGTYDLDEWKPSGGIAGHVLHFLATYTRPLIRHPLFWIIIAVFIGRWIYQRRKIAPK